MPQVALQHAYVGMHTMWLGHSWAHHAPEVPVAPEAPVAPVAPAYMQITLLCRMQLVDQASVAALTSMLVDAVLCASMV